jgi:hypothetical protein
MKAGTMREHTGKYLYTFMPHSGKGKDNIPGGKWSIGLENFLETKRRYPSPPTLLGDRLSGGVGPNPGVPQPM